ncbi:MAG: hypothetical protein KC431_21270, partial [Myxococcales bacterium]|nr:hypothetical protein [Myxococcales bacterium]
DLTRVAVAGHSAGGGAAANQTDKPGVRVSIPLASGQSAKPSATLESTLFMGGLADGVVAYSGTQNAYDGSAPVKRLVGLDNAGHLAFSDICELENDQGQDILEIAVEAGVCGAEFAGFLFDCDPSFLDAATAKMIINHATTSVLEEVLQCSDAGDRFADLQTTYPDVAEYQEALQ